MKHPWAAAVMAAGGLIGTGSAGGVGTVAGTDIHNQAEITFEVAGAIQTRTSNIVTLTVDEMLDVDVLLQSPQRLVRPSDTGQALLFTVTNTGNGDERIELGFESVVPGDDFDPVPALPTIVFDVDGSGDFSAADMPYVPGTNDPVLAPDQSVDVLVVNDIPGALSDGSLGLSELTAQAATGFGSPGANFPGQGDGGVDAVVGASGAQARDTGEYLVGNVQLELIKAATVSDPTGGSQPAAGASIVYTVQVRALGTGAANGTVFQDAIPANTTYVPGSLRLNGSVLTDAQDSDPGEFATSGALVIVDLGALSPAHGAQNVQFTVTID